ncbi:MAG: metallophosphoesterase [Erythrobacter sp.]
MTTRMLHISDVHFGVEDGPALDAVAAILSKERPDVVLCTGDITQRAKHSEYASAAKWFESLGAPVVLQAGNHDMPYYNLWERFTDPYRRFHDLNEKIGSAFDSEDVVLVPLVTTVRIQPRFPWSDGYVRTRPLDRTLARLRQLEGDPRTKVVICHHPLLGASNAERNPTIGGDDAFAAIAAAGADAVLSGHVHIPFDQIREREGQQMRMIGVGTISTRLRRGFPPSCHMLTCGARGKIAVEQFVLGAES